MRIRRRTLRRLSLFLSVVVFLLLAPVSAAAALSQNLLVNPGFDGSSAGWTIETKADPNPERVDTMSLAWTAMDASGSAASGSLGLHVRVGYHVAAEVWARQCREVPEGRTVSFGGKFRTARKYGGAGAAVETAFFASLDCSGATLGSGTTFVGTPFFSPETNSNGLWSPVSASTLSPPGTRSMRVSVHGFAAGFSVYGQAWVDAEADDVYAVVEPSPAASWVLPSAAKLSGAAGSVWTTGVTLANPDADDALVTLKFLGHDGDGSSGPEKTVFVRAGTLVEYPDVLGTLFDRPQDYGAIRITSSSVNVVVQSETSTPVPSGGTVGQALPAFGPADFAGASPKTLAPIRENAEFRTNLVLANATEIPVTAHVELFPTNGFSLGSLGSRDVELPPLGMTQINRVATALGATWQEPGYIAVSTPTPGGLVAAYASIIDNITNDPRTLLPQGMAPTPPGPNLLTNPGFDRDLSGWTRSLSIGGAPDVSSGWTTSDASGAATSGGLALHAFADIHDHVQIDYRQCVPVVGGPLVTFGGKFRATRQSGLARSGVEVYTYRSSDCSESADSAYLDYASVDSLFGEGTSFGTWLPVTSSAVINPWARSMSLQVWALAYGNTAGWPFPYGPASVDTVADDIFATVGPAPPTYWILPSAAWIHGTAHWTTRLTLCNPGWDASVYLEWLGHDAAGYDPYGGIRYDLLPRSTLTLDWETSHPETWGAIRIGSVWPISLPPAFLQSETTAPALGGTVGQALAALASPDLASALPKTLAPIRENAAFRTNLVLAAAINAPVTAHVVLFDADGTTLGARDVDLPPLGMTQINRVASALGATTLDVGRISVSTATPGGLVAAYASVIDNVTNDPRTLLPRGGVGGANLLSNAGFDRDDAGWKSTLSSLGSPTWSSSWVAPDAAGRADSGGLALQATSDVHDGIVALRWQCVGLLGGTHVNFGAKFRTARQSAMAGTEIRVGFFPSADCGRYEDSYGGGSASSLVSQPSADVTSNGAWLPAASSAAIPTSARSMGVYVRAWASGIYNGPGPSSVGYVDAVVDNVFASVVP